MQGKKEWSDLELERMTAMAEAKPHKTGLLAAFDHVTDGEVSRRLTQAGGKREGAGRPPKEEADKVTERFWFNLTPAEAAMVDARTILGETRNQAARRLLLEYLTSEN